MTTSFKWIIPSMLVIVLVVFIAYVSSVQNINSNTTKEVEVLADTISVGLIRSEIDEDGNVDGRFFDKDELIANLTANVAKVQKNHDYDIHIDYVFFDKDGEVTEQDEHIRSVQFRVQYVDDDGEVKANAEKHLAINQL